jgi:nifR3 family TIM-barrel protein
MNAVADILAANNVLLAPMAGVTEAPFRAICKRLGAGLTYTEMVSAKGLHYNPESPASLSILTFDPAETPCAVQIFGAEPDVMAEQSARLCSRFGSDLALIDINMGCPVTKVVAKGEGSALMRTPDLAAAIVSAVADAVPVPVTVKFRAGWDASSVNAVEFGRAMQDAGASAVCVHGRTADQLYRGHANWDVIGDVKNALDIPVIGSGDVFSAADVAAMLDRTSADAVMVARGSQGNPWIFREARALLDEGIVLPPPTAAERIDMALEHAAALVAFGGERGALRMRKHIAWYFSDMPGATYARAGVNDCKTFADIEKLLTEYRAFLTSRGALANPAEVPGFVEESRS